MEPNEGECDVEGGVSSPHHRILHETRYLKLSDGSNKKKRKKMEKRKTDEERDRETHFELGTNTIHGFWAYAK